MTTVPARRTPNSLLLDFRRAIKDTNFASPQLDVVVTAGAVGVLEVIDGHLLITGDLMGSVDLVLASTTTIEDLVAALNNIAGVTADVLQDADPSHAALDLQFLAPTDIFNKVLILNSRRWSDDELAAFINHAISRHNNSVSVDASLGFLGGYTAQNIPSEHFYFVLLLAQIEMLKALVQDSVKRKGTDLTVADYVALKMSLEQEYAGSLKRFLERRMPLTVDQTKDIGSGDIVEGTSYRQSLHTARFSRSQPHTVPIGVAPAPSKEALSATALGDGRVQLSWTRNRDPHFNRYEVWRGLTRGVGNLGYVLAPTLAIEAPGVRVMTQYTQPLTTWVDGYPIALDLDTYYYVVYVFNNNGEATPTNIAVVLVT